jgi:hypothetical protein
MIVEPVIATPHDVCNFVVIGQHPNWDTEYEVAAIAQNYRSQADEPLLRKFQTHLVGHLNEFCYFIVHHARTSAYYPGTTVEF